MCLISTLYSVHILLELTTLREIWSTANWQCIGLASIPIKMYAAVQMIATLILIQRSLEAIWYGRNHKGCLQLQTCVTESIPS